jgi:hypothetical protein
MNSDDPPQLGFVPLWKRVYQTLRRRRCENSAPASGGVLAIVLRRLQTAANHRKIVSVLVVCRWSLWAGRLA